MGLFENIEKAVKRFGEFSNNSMNEAMEGCMDEHNNVETAGVAYFGTAGSHGTADGGSEKLYPMGVRAVVAEYEPIITGILGELAVQMTGKPLAKTGHEECGAFGAQGVTKPDEIAKRTRGMVERAGNPKVVWGGMIRENPTPIPTILGGEVSAHLHRPKKHTHTADHSIVTVGGGIDHVRELSRVAREHGGDAFTVSMDWLAVAKEVGIAPATINEIASLGLDLADKIADGVVANHDMGGGAVIFDANRLPEQMAAENTSMALDILEGLGFTDIPIIKD